MKTYVFLIASLFIFLSCEKENLVSPEVKPFNGPFGDLSLSFAKDYVPIDVFRNHTKAVFVNSFGEELVLEMLHRNGFKKKQRKNQEYQIEYFDVWIADNIDDPNFSFFLIAEVDHMDSGDTLISVRAILASEMNYSMHPSLLILNQEINCAFKKLDHINIAGYEFTNLYTNPFPNPIGLNSYTQLFYCPTKGFVGFEGEHGMMWALKEYR